MAYQANNQRGISLYHNELSTVINRLNSKFLRHGSFFKRQSWAGVYKIFWDNCPWAESLIRRVMLVWELAEICWADVLDELILYTVMVAFCKAKFLSKSFVGVIRAVYSLLSRVQWHGGFLEYVGTLEIPQYIQTMKGQDTKPPH